MASSVTSSCSTDEYCQMLTTSIIPACERLSGAAGCWCGHQEAFYRCSTCVAGLTDGQTPPEAFYPFRGGKIITKIPPAHTYVPLPDFEESCRVYEQLIENSTSVIELPIKTTSASSTVGLSATALVTPSNVSGERNKLPVGIIIGGVLGAVFGLIIVFFAVRYAERSIRGGRSRRSSQNDHYYKSVEYAGESALNGHLSRIVYTSPYECIMPRLVPGDTQPDSTHVITSVESPEPTSPPPYQSSTLQSHFYLSDRKPRVAG
ncbi:hypothetical protein B0J17DRAFT_719631 [Rhizoctonia solani]|nr:hypothetical protein B0J17DRAFT_719631 [Rhizoctonia solani]